MGERYLITGAQLGILMSEVPRYVRENIGNELLRELNGR